MKQIPGFYWADEIFEFMDLKYKRILGFKDVTRTCIRHQMYRKQARKARYFGFDTKYLECQHLRDEWVGMSIAEYTDLLSGLGFGKFILLYRKNYLRQMVSHEVAVQRKLWHSSSRIEKPNRVELDFMNFRIGTFRGELINLFEMMDESYEVAREVLARKEYLNLVYEEHILPNPQIAIDRILEFLNIHLDKSINCNLRRTNPFPLRQIVANYEDLSEYLVDSRYAWMLEHD